MSTCTDERIERVIHNLIPTTAFDDKFGPVASLESRLAYYHTPGVSIAVIDDCKIVWACGYGLAEANSTRRVTPTTLFQAGSISKPIFALAVMRLVQEGVLDLDTDVNTKLVAWHIPANGDWQPRITLRHLLSHTAGLTVHGFPGYNSEEPIPNIVQVLNGDVPANTPKVETNIIPGIQCRYSGGGMVVAQQLVVDVLGKSFPDLMRELVLDPLGMSNSCFEQPLQADRVHQAATAHPWKGIPLPGRWHCYPEMAAAGLWTTAADLARVGVELMGVLNDKQIPRLLSRQSIEAMFSPQLPDQQDGQASPYYGLGFYCHGQKDGFHFGHGGWNEGFTAKMQFYPHIGKGAVVMVNANEGHDMLDEVIRSIAREYNWPDSFPNSTSPYPLAQLDGYTGTYLTNTGMPVVVNRRGTDLLLQLAQQPHLRMMPTAELDFIIPVLNTRVTFERNQDGLISAMTIVQQGQQIKALKQPVAA